MMPSPPAQPSPGARPPLLVLAFGWSGAAVFVWSLIYFLYAYLVRYGDPAPSGPVTLPLAVNVGLFSIFALHHSVFARTGVKRWLVSLVPPALERSLFTWVSSLLFLGVCWLWQPVPGELYRVDGAWRWGLHALQVLGLVFTYLGSRALDVLDLGGVRQLMPPSAHHGAEAHVPLVTSGAYRLVRHPIYFGWVLLVFGMPDMTATRFAFAAISTAYLAAAIPLEERALRAVFGAEYRRYARAVRWRMIPGLY